MVNILKASLVRQRDVRDSIPLADASGSHEWANA